MKSVYNIWNINDIAQEGPDDPRIISMGAAKGRTISKEKKNKVLNYNKKIVYVNKIYIYI